MKSNWFCSLGVLTAGIVISVSFNRAHATVPFTENFTSSASNWADASGQSLATFVPSGGPDWQQLRVVDL